MHQRARTELDDVCQLHSGVLDVVHAEALVHEGLGHRLGVRHARVLDEDVVKLAAAREGDDLLHKLLVEVAADAAILEVHKRVVALQHWLEPKGAPTAAGRQARRHGCAMVHTIL